MWRSGVFFSLATCLDGEVSQAIVWILSDVVLGLLIFLCVVWFLLCVISGKVLPFNLSVIFLISFGEAEKRRSCDVP